jgi:hypothetical protein
MKLNKTTLILSILTIIILSVLGWYFTRPQGVIEFALAPQQLTFVIDGKEREISHDQKMKLAPGTYKAAFTRDGFQTVNKTITVEEDKQQRIVMALTPLTEAAKKLLADSPESQKVINEYKQVKSSELINSLPLSGVNYSINACSSVKQPKTDAKAVCIVTTTAQGEKAAKDTLQRLGYNLDDLEILVGTDNIRSVIRTDSYRIDYYKDVQTEGTDKLALFVTPLNLPYVAYTTTFDPASEAVKTAALNDLTQRGYDLNQYAIYYSNIYLSKYNPGADQPDEHAMPPIQ